MPEGPEVRRYADQLASVLCGQELCHVDARTKAAKQWLSEHPNTLIGRKVESVRSRGKNLVGKIEGGYYFYSHLMMWGRWQIEAHSDEEIPRDRRERARLETQNAIAILMSAPVFELGKGEPFEQIEYLSRLGPDSLPYPDEPSFNSDEFLNRLTTSQDGDRTIGAALLDQQICAGIGNYLRAEILFLCKIDPWKCVRDLTKSELRGIAKTVPQICRLAYENGGATTEESTKERIRYDESLRRGDGDWHTKHYVFRRTNLPCVECGEIIRQKRQFTREIEDGEKTRIIYFCPNCQNTTVELKPVKKKKPANVPTNPERK